MCSERYRYSRKYRLKFFQIQNNMDKNYSKPEKHIDIFLHIAPYFVSIPLFMRSLIDTNISWHFM